MKIYISITGILIVGWLVFATINTPAQKPQIAKENNPELAAILTNAPPPDFTTRLEYIQSFAKEKAVLDAYHKGNISKAEAMLALGLLGDKVSLDTYGKVVDQNGQPLAEVKVQANVGIGFGDYSAYHTMTDAHGLFHFLGLHGKGLGIELQKNGYYFDYMLPSAQRSKGYLPDVNNPMVLTMWKLKGAEPMKHVKIDSSLPCDGGGERFDLLTDRMNRTGNGPLSQSGDLTIKLTRDPLILNSRNRYKPFNWSIIIGVTNGGLLEVTNIYPFEAPVGEYQSTITLDFPTNMVGWKSELNRAYFFKAQNGQIYGRMMLQIDASRPQPPTYFSAEIYANPNSSRNLEFDPAKQIR